MTKPINLASARPIPLAGPTPETVQAQMLDEVRQTREMTGDVLSHLKERWDQSIMMARAEEIARAKRNDVWIAGAGMAIGVAITFAAMSAVSAVISRNTQEAMTSGVVIGQAEANQEALNEQAATPADDKGYQRTPSGWRQK